MLAARSVVLVDSMIVIEAVRTRCWNAISGQLEIVTSAECGEELRRGDTTALGYVSVAEEDLARVRIAPVTPAAAVALRLAYPHADGLDAGERDLLALALERKDDPFICSCDKAAVVAAHSMGWLDRLISLEDLAISVGVRPSPALKVQYTEARMSEWRTTVRLGGPI